MNVKKILVAVAVSTVLAGSAACSATRTHRAPGEQLDDAVILSNVKSALISDSKTDAHEINVDVNRGIVQLNGFVDSPAERSRATILATEVKGVMEVRNNLTVKQADETAGDHVDDALLTTKVKAALVESPDTKANQINVETNNGVVQLSGFVNNEKARSAATTVAMSVKGVKNVENKISIKSY
jgi:hyperosmotically inducible periplasmic protein